MKELNPENKFAIPITGSLGLLALGYRGVQMWREVRDKALLNQASKIEESPE